MIADSHSQADSSTPMTTDSEDTPTVTEAMLPVLPELGELPPPGADPAQETLAARELDRLLTGETGESDLLGNPASPPVTENFTENVSEIPLVSEPSELTESLPTPEPVAEVEINSESHPGAEPEKTSEAFNTSDLVDQKQQLITDIAALQTEKATLLSQQLALVQTEMERIVQENLGNLEQRKQVLMNEIERLERRQAKIQQEMRTTFAGASQELAIRVQGFKDYLVGSLQDLVAAAEQLELTSGDTWNTTEIPAAVPQATPIATEIPNFAEQQFIEQRRQIQRILEQYRTRPDYYGPPWQLRRTFEPVHGERVQNWFFTQGGRGVVRTLGSRLQNILVAGAIISIAVNLYGDRCRALILANSPERLGEWRRGLQDCLGISRSDFGPDRGVVLFESPEALIQRAERLVEDKLLPLVLIDDTQEQVDLALLQFPLWLAFAPDPQQPSSNYYF
ncbi:MAG: DUF3086 domain-containing protein [Microcystaceae cyanobacterium]